MKLLKFENLGKYHFAFKFENDDFEDANLKKLIEKKVSLTELKTAKINKEWGCLEFNNGMIDIEPETLYKFCHKNY